VVVLTTVLFWVHCKRTTGQSYVVER
jgi:hypothetical protein